MSIDKRMSLSLEEFDEPERKYEGFERKSHIEGRKADEEESFYDFLEKGCKRLNDIRFFNVSFESDKQRI